MDNSILEALAKVPELVETTKTIIEQNERINTVYGKALEHRAQAEIPNEEVQKVVRYVTDGVQRTRCAAPDVSVSSDLIAQGVLNRTQGAVEDAVREVIKNTPITLEHHHTHMTAFGLTKMAEEKTRNILTLACVALGALLLWIGAALFVYYRSDTYWGEQYYEVVNSPYATEAERDMLWENIYPKSVLPKEFKTNPSFVKNKIRQNKKVLRQRRRKGKGKGKNGNYSTTVPLER